MPLITQENFIAKTEELKNYFITNMGVFDLTDYVFVTPVDLHITEVHGIKVLYDKDHPKDYVGLYPRLQALDYLKNE